jgi:hypothetical protein
VLTNKILIGIGQEANAAPVVKKMLLNNTTDSHNPYHHASSALSSDGLSEWRSDKIDVRN